MATVARHGAVEVRAVEHISRPGAMRAVAHNTGPGAVRVVEHITWPETVRVVAQKFWPGVMRAVEYRIGPGGVGVVKYSIGPGAVRAVEHAEATKHWGSQSRGAEESAGVDYFPRQLIASSRRASVNRSRGPSSLCQICGREASDMRYLLGVFWEPKRSVIIKFFIRGSAAFIRCTDDLTFFPNKRFLRTDEKPLIIRDGIQMALKYLGTLMR